jgi:hypothetical protein
VRVSAEGFLYQGEATLPEDLRDEDRRLLPVISLPWQMYLSSCLVLSDVEYLADFPSPLLRLSTLSDSHFSIEIPSNLPKNPFPTSTGFETKLSVGALMWSIPTSSLITRG